MEMRLTTGREFDARICARCESRVGDEKFCRCGAPTAHASFEDRSKYELEQWRAYKAQQSA
jgi:hypothetical protein